jgi:hypothetical protein
LENSGEPTAEIPVDENTEDPTDPMTENSITVYVNDSFKEEVTNEDIELESRFQRRMAW